MATKFKKTAVANAVDQLLVSIRFTTPTRMDGQDFEQDQVVEINEDAAAYLVDAGLAEPQRTDPADLSLA